MSASLFSSSLTLAGVALVLFASAHDLISRTIPNWVALALALVGFCARIADGQLLAGLLAAGVVFLLATFCWLRGWLGGGDVKLFAAAAIAVPPASVLPFVMTATMAGGILALVYLAARPFFSLPGLSAPAGRCPHSLLGRAMRAERWRIRRGGPLPYACAIAAGFLFVVA